MTRPGDHRLELAEGWALWTWMVVRGAGFPAQAVLELASPAAAAAADELIALDEPLARSRREAIAALEPLLAERTGRARRTVDKALRALQRGRARPRSPELEAEVGALRALADLEAEQEQQRERLERAFAEELERTSLALRGVAGDPRFREALLWQNPRALYTGVDRVLSRPANRHNSRDRQHEHLVASYLQRYCAKNDTIGFFGPIGWGRLDPALQGVAARPGPALAETRRVYFEHWAIDALASQLSDDTELLPDVAPRRMPTIRLEGSVLHYGVGKRTELPPEFARLLEACDGERTAREIAEALIGDPALDLDGEQEVYELLEELADRRLIIWRLEVPPQLIRPERHLAQLLSRAESHAGVRARAALEELEARRKDVARASGEPEALGEALGTLEETFERLTIRPATRREGRTYGARTLVYEDCRRGLELRLGAEIPGRIGPALSLVLRSARWYTHSVAERYRAGFERIYDELCRESGDGLIDYILFYSRASELLPGPGGSELIDEVLAELHLRWSQILGLDDSERRANRSSSDIAAAAREAFQAPHPGWPTARYHSPDVMLASPSLEELGRGRWLAVMGELHAGLNTAITPLFFKECPEGQDLIRAYEQDVPLAVVEPVRPKEEANRADISSPLEQAFHVELGSTRSWRPRAQVIAAAELVVERASSGLVVRTRDGRASFDVISFFEHQVRYGTAPRFSLLSGASHLPRVTLDDTLVVVREQWRFSPDDLPFAKIGRGSEQFASARRWARDAGMPRCVFVKVPEEPKPVYVDFDSAIYVEILAKLARRASSVTVTEMLPTLDDTWLPDAEGRAYTSELRLVAVDPVPWRPPGR